LGANNRGKNHLAKALKQEDTNMQVIEPLVPVNLSNPILK
jgi:hypothetical protein